MEGVWPDDLRFETKLRAEVVTGYTRFEEGDVLVPKITPTFSHGRSSIARGLDGRPGVGTTELHVLRPLAGVSARWLYYVTKSSDFIQDGEATLFGVAGQKRIDSLWLRDFR